jgi:hypothetical protein
VEDFRISLEEGGREGGREGFIFDCKYNNISKIDY